VFFDALFGSIFNLKIIVPFCSEHCVLHLDRREERRGLSHKVSTRGDAKTKAKISPAVHDRIVSR